ncbi:MAG: protoglobin domain-containing protein [Acidobacteriota bacterium]
MGIPGYTYATNLVSRSPVSADELQRLLQAVGWSGEDERHRKLAAEVLREQVEEILDLWYGFVGSVPHLLAAFQGPDGVPVQPYLEAVRRRFGQWILDTCERPFDQSFLDYQHEIGLRHHRTKKNKTDGVQAAEHIPLRYVITLIAPIVLTIKPFLARLGHSAEEVEKMFAAWTKAVVLQVALWSYPYTREGDW